MKLAFSSEMKKIDQMAQIQFNISAEMLMESAGQVAAQEIQNHFPNNLKGNVLVLVGPGNNGGDSMVVARHLSNMGIGEIDVYLISDPNPNNNLFLNQFERLKKTNVNFVSEVSNWNKYSIFIDGIFGIGISKDISGNLYDLINNINQSEGIKVSLDIPSGLNPDTGKKMGISIQADLTITFGLAKPGFYIEEGPQHCGKLVIRNIGFPLNLFEVQAQSVSLTELKDVSGFIQPENETTNKAKRGKVLVIGGSEKYWGAGLLCSQAALRTGSGYVYWASFQNPIKNLPEMPEIIFQALDQIQDFSVFDCVVMGPGLGISENTYKKIFDINNDNVILDADALNSLAKYGIKELNSKWIITPHTGELSRLINISSKEIEHNRFEAIKSAKKLLKCNILLKGFHTIVLSDCFHIIGSGNKALAKAGTGDVLAGMIGGFTAVSKNLVKGSLLGSFAHGWIADQWVENGKSDLSLTPTDILNEIPRALRVFQDEKEY